LIERDGAEIMIAARARARAPETRNCVAESTARNAETQKERERERIALLSSVARNFASGVAAASAFAADGAIAEQLPLRNLRRARAARDA